MWMLLDPSARRPAAKVAGEVKPNDVGTPRRSAKPRAEVERTSLLEFLGAAAASPTTNGAAAAVSVFMHPGRAPVGTVGIERIFDQFECGSPDVYASIAEAEFRHAGDVGFLLEVTRPFTDPHGRRHPCGVLFARSVRD